MKKNALPALTGLRFIAAFHVLLFHQALVYMPRGSLGLRSIIASGYVGVSLFFTLSGFILAYNYLEVAARGALDRRSFWTARFARVYPVYALGLLLALPSFLALMAKTGPLSSQLHRIVGISAAGITLTQSWAPSAVCVWNCPGWSLSVEAFFYLLFPFAAVSVARVPGRLLLPACVGLWLLSLAGAGLYMLISPDGLGGASAQDKSYWLDVVRFNPLIRLPEFLVGMLLGRYYLETRREVRSRFLLLVAGLVIIGVLAASSYVPYILLHNGLLAPCFALVIYSLAHGQGIIARILSSPVATILGESSYALYILHMPIWWWMRVLGKALGVEWLASPWYFAAYLCVAVIASILVLRLVEEPTRMFIRDRLIARKAARTAHGT